MLTEFKGKSQKKPGNPSEIKHLHRNQQPAVQIVSMNEDKVLVCNSFGRILEQSQYLFIIYTKDIMNVQVVENLGNVDAHGEKHYTELVQEIWTAYHTC